MSASIAAATWRLLMLISELDRRQACQLQQSARERSTHAQRALRWGFGTTGR